MARCLRPGYACGALLRITVFLVVLFTRVTPVSGVTCHVCKDTIAGCTGTASCPLVTGPVKNYEAISKGTFTSVPNVAKILPAELMVRVVTIPAMAEKLTHLL